MVIRKIFDHKFWIKKWILIQDWYYKGSANNVHVLRASYKKGNLSEMCSE